MGSSLTQASELNRSRPHASTTEDSAADHPPIGVANSTRKQPGPRRHADRDLRRTVALLKEFYGRGPTPRQVRPPGRSGGLPDGGRGAPWSTPQPVRDPQGIHGFAKRSCDLRIALNSIASAVLQYSFGCCSYSASKTAFPSLMKVLW